MTTTLILSPLMSREEAARRESDAYRRGIGDGMTEAIAAATEALQIIIAELPAEVRAEVAQSAARAVVLDAQDAYMPELRRPEGWTGPDTVSRVQDLVRASWQGPEATIVAAFEDLTGERL